MAETIEILIGPNGEVTVEGKGIVGPDCVKLTEALEDALGDVTKRTKKAEYSQARQVLRKAGA